MLIAFSSSTAQRNCFYINPLSPLHLSAFITRSIHLNFFCELSSAWQNPPFSSVSLVMERPIGALVNAGPNLPVGFRFTPTDGELIVHYLRRKVFNLPLPSHFVPECDFYDKHPRDLPGNEEEKHTYFFCRKKQRNGVHGCRYWTPIGEDRIVDPVSNRTIGIRRTLVLNETMSCPNGTKLMWIMHEFCLPATIGMRKTGEGEWAVYHAFHKKIKPNRNNGRNKLNLNQTEGMSLLPDCIDLRVQESSDFDPPPPPMSP